LQHTGKNRRTRQSLYGEYYDSDDDDEYAWDYDDIDEMLPGSAPGIEPKSDEPATKKPKLSQAAVQTATEAVRAGLLAAGMQVNAPTVWKSR
jgi:hypothetical protein